MKKICILSTANIKHMTLISLYTDKMIKDNIDYDIIYMDKYGEYENFEANSIYRFENRVSRSDNKIIKILKYLRFIRYAKEILNKNKYDFIIVWNELTSLIFSKYLSKRYKNKYCINIRDYLYNDYPILKRIFAVGINNAAFTTISSDGFKAFLPEHQYIHVHSLNMNLLSKLKPKKRFQRKDERIKITFVGNVRFFEINKEILEVFKNDTRFELCYFGTNSEVLEDYCKENKIKNVSFHSSFPVEETPKFINETDIINNIYGNNSKKLDYALSIKLYYGIYNNLPIIVSSSTYMSKIIKKYDIGYVVEEIDNSLPDNIYNWYTHNDFDKFSKNCKKFLEDIEKSNIKFNQVYGEYIKS